MFSGQKPCSTLQLVKCLLFWLQGSLLWWTYNREGIFFRLGNNFGEVEEPVETRGFRVSLERSPWHHLSPWYVPLFYTGTVPKCRPGSTAYHWVFFEWVREAPVRPTYCRLLRRRRRTPEGTPTSRRGLFEGSAGCMVRRMCTGRQRQSSDVMRFRVY